MNYHEDDDVDDQIFFGKLTVKEFKKHILWNPNAPNFSSDFKADIADSNESIEILKTHSEPNLRLVHQKPSISKTQPISPTVSQRESDISFLNIENMVSKLSPRTSDNVELNNTLEVIDYILNHGSKQNKTQKAQKIEDQQFKNYTDLKTPQKHEQYVDLSEKLENIVIPDTTEEENGSCEKIVEIKTSLQNNNISADTLEHNMVELITPKKTSRNLIAISLGEKVKTEPEQNLQEKNIGNSTFQRLDGETMVSLGKMVEMCTPKKCNEKSKIWEIPQIYIEAASPSQEIQKFSPKKEIFPEETILKPANKPIETLASSGSQESLKFYTPMKSEYYSNNNQFATPSNSKQQTPIFKTPANLMSNKKPSTASLKNTPVRSNTYQYITSPIAAYVENCSQVPLITEVHPKQQLPSAIPKIVKNTITKVNNKENINLPPVAYKSAKKTRVITLLGENKLPQSQSAKKITSSLPRPTAMKHTKKENMLKKTLLSNNDDSFANLSDFQAEVSVCTQRTALNLNNKH